MKVESKEWKSLMELNTPMGMLLSVGVIATMLALVGASAVTVVTCTVDDSRGMDLTTIQTAINTASNGDVLVESSSSRNSNSGIEPQSFPLIHGSPDNFECLNTTLFSANGFGILSFDISNPTIITSLEQIPTNNYAVSLSSLQIENTDYLFAADRVFSTGDIIVYDASDPNNLEYKTKYNVVGAPYFIESAEIQGRELIFASVSNLTIESGFVDIIDFSNPLLPERICRIDSVGGRGNLAVGTVQNNSYLFVSGSIWKVNKTKLYIYNVTKPDSPVLITELELGNNIWRKYFTYISGTPYLFVHTDNIHIFDISDIFNPLEIGQIPTHGSNPYYVDFIIGQIDSSYFAFVTEFPGSVHIYNLDNLSSPAQTDEIAIERAEGLYFTSGNTSSFLYVGSGSGSYATPSVWCLNVSDPSNIITEDIYNLPIAHRID